MDDSKIFMFPDGGTGKTSSDVNSLLICVVKEFKSIGMIVGNINNYYSL